MAASAAFALAAAGQAASTVAVKFQPFRRFPLFVTGIAAAVVAQPVVVAYFAVPQ